MYKVIIAVVLFVIVNAISFVSGYKYRDVAYMEDAIEKVKEDEVKVTEVIKYRDKIKVVYRDRIKEVEVAKDITGCLDTPYSAMGIGMHKDPVH